MDQRAVYPIAEMFDSCQGEGLYTGARMLFVRLAGCTVGKPYPQDMYKEKYSTDTAERPLHLPIYTERCTLFDNRSFPCDTDYRVKERLSVHEICNRIKASGAERVCITGGEPFMYNLEPLINGLWSGLILEGIHIETSGTVPIQRALPTLYSYDCEINQGQSAPWITVSPKQGVLPEMCKLANELKILVDEQFYANPVLPDFVKMHPLVYLQPINAENELNHKNLDYCKELQLKVYPQFRISVQMHKVMHVR